MPHQTKSAPLRHYGKHRGVVVDNIDPLQLGRVLVQVPKVIDGGGSRWAMPCVPVAGHQSGLFLLPAIGAPVWVEFEQGDPELPIWVGGYWVDAGELPVMAPAGQGVPAMLLQTPGQNSVLVSDMPGPDGGVLLRAQNGASIAVNEAGITISNGRGASIVLAGTMVTINDGALTVV
jgi:uncharacterized protein involved in type VI secretion and phage assembly